MYPYASEQHAMTDVLRLSRGMTYKAAICELPYGGGKSVMIADIEIEAQPIALDTAGATLECLYAASDAKGRCRACCAIREIPDLVVRPTRKAMVAQRVNSSARGSRTRSFGAV